MKEISHRSPVPFAEPQKSLAQSSFPREWATSDTEQGRILAVQVPLAMWLREAGIARPVVLDIGPGQGAVTLRRDLSAVLSAAGFQGGYLLGCDIDDGNLVVDWYLLAKQHENPAAATGGQWTTCFFKGDYTKVPDEPGSPRAHFLCLERVDPVLQASGGAHLVMSTNSRGGTGESLERSVMSLLAPNGLGLVGGGDNCASGHFSRPAFTYRVVTPSGPVGDLVWTALEAACIRRSFEFENRFASSAAAEVLERLKALLGGVAESNGC